MSCLPCEYFSSFLQQQQVNLEESTGVAWVKVKFSMRSSVLIISCISLLGVFDAAAFRLLTFCQMQPLAEQKWALMQWAGVDIYAEPEPQTATFPGAMLFKINTLKRGCPSSPNALSTQNPYHAS